MKKRLRKSSGKPKISEMVLKVAADANDTERRRMMAGIDKDSRLVVYCQSSGCQFAEKVSS